MNICFSYATDTCTHSFFFLGRHGTIADSSTCDGRITRGEFRLNVAIYFDSLVFHSYLVPLLLCLSFLWYISLFTTGDLRAGGRKAITPVSCAIMLINKTSVCVFDVPL